jgi:hypothetical protein
MKSKPIKKFKRYLKEERETYYTLDLLPNMTREEIVHQFNELLPLTLKMIKEGKVLITVEPVFEGEEQ